ncbi:MAG: hypothetical protein ABI120_23885 [Gemmatimonadaceae bacterium]
MIKHVRVIAVAAALATLPAVASAQDKQFEVGTKLVNVGLMVGSESYGSLGVGGGLEVGFKSVGEGKVVLGIGGSIGIARSTYNFIGAGYSSTAIPVLGFVHGHYQLPSVPKLDLYAGPAVGISLARYSYDNGYCGTTVNCGGNTSDVSAGIQAGARWALTPTVLGWAQLSGGTRMPFLNVGISFKF